MNQLDSDESAVNSPMLKHNYDTTAAIVSVCDLVDCVETSTSARFL